MKHHHEHFKVKLILTVALGLSAFLSAFWPQLQTHSIILATSANFLWIWAA
jgi:hypothetical protein